MDETAGSNNYLAFLGTFHGEIAKARALAAALEALSGVSDYQGRCDVLAEAIRLNEKTAPSVTTVG